MARKLKHVVSVNDAPRDHFYLAVCRGRLTESPERGSAYASCTWFAECGKGASLKAHREARKHANRCPDHETQVIDLSAMRCVTKYRFTAIDEMHDQNAPPPF